jgi:hypothetical protein
MSFTRRLPSRDMYSRTALGSKGRTCATSGWRTQMDATDMSLCPAYIYSSEHTCHVLPPHKPAIPRRGLGISPAGSPHSLALRVTPAKRLNSRSLGGLGISPAGSRCATPAKRLNTQIPRMARDFACGLSLRYARKTAQHADPSHGSGFRLRALAALRPQNGST